ncbi:EF-P beta-lysylation protein EpmB [Kangiella taiwanensis]|uniref:L-lysine 2,3-aminomutase n=1 Tax=Kangiella taiwanensis TaxID=1079179 RepID=A0ABP8HSC1_9GAMM|nr:EF-P beta-lysylation protein EpmB [Kangiella taiwanensis]
MIQNVQILTRNDSYWQDNEWKKLLSGAFSSPIQLLKHLELSPESLPYPILDNHAFAQRVPQGFVDRMTKGNPFDPLLLQVLPLAEETKTVPGYVSDPLDEHESAIPGLLHKYKSRVLVMLSTACAINCRYCFRREFPYSDNQLSKSGWQDIVDYLQAHPEVNEVILSGGDPLAVNDGYFAEFIRLIGEVAHIKRLRIHSRLPVVIPQRVTHSLVETLENCRFQTVFVTHVNHPNEVDKWFGLAMERLSKAGVTLLNQTVLLKDINDNATTLANLSEKLFQHKILPYYLHLLDKVSGAHHFDVSETEAQTLTQQLQVELAGFLVPKLVREEGGKPHKSWIDLGNNNQ